MLKRLFDIAASLVALCVLGPVIAAAAIVVRLTSKGPAFYCATRAGVGGRPFTLFKLRTMRVNQGGGASAITGHSDPRVFPFGNLLRKTKIDELPQLWNILRGDMSIVGPRPEDMVNVERFYGALGMATLAVRPGLSGVGSIYNYTQGEQMLVGDNPEEIYARDLLPIKLALEMTYIRNASFLYDLQIVFRTIIAIVQIASGRKAFNELPEMEAAQQILRESEQVSLAA